MEISQRISEAELLLPLAGLCCENPPARRSGSTRKKKERKKGNGVVANCPAARPSLAVAIGPPLGSDGLIPARC